MIELSGSGAGAADMWAARANSRAELREGRRLARSRRRMQVRMFVWEGYSTDGTLDQS